MKIFGRGPKTKTGYVRLNAAYHTKKEAREEAILHIEQLGMEPIAVSTPELDRLTMQYVIRYKGLQPPERGIFNPRRY